MITEVPFDYTVVRSRRRRTVSLTVDKGCVKVRVPALTDSQWIERWVKSQVGWVLPRLERQVDALERFRVRIEQGAPIMLRGQNLRLHWRRAKRSEVIEIEDRLEVLLSSRISRPEPEAVEQLLKRWLSQQARSELCERCFALGERVGMRPVSVDVRDYRRKWGQCTSRGEITLNWRLIHLPLPLQEYVMIHELCHLQELNHGPSFWRLVKKFCPDYRELRDVMALKYPYLIW